MTTINEVYSDPNRPLRGEAALISRACRDMRDKAVFFTGAAEKVYNHSTLVGERVSTLESYTEIVSQAARNARRLHTIADYELYDKGITDQVSHMLVDGAGFSARVAVKCADIAKDYSTRAFLR